jgi:hypothetical protein
MQEEFQKISRKHVSYNVLPLILLYDRKISKRAIYKRLWCAGEIKNLPYRKISMSSRKWLEPAHRGHDYATCFLRLRASAVRRDTNPGNALYCV